MFAITQHRYGPPSVLTPAELPDPVAGPRDVVVEVRALVVTQGDLRLRSGAFPGLFWLPARLALGLTGPRASVGGTSFAGRVCAVGREVTGVAVGDDVFGLRMSGAHAERIVLPKDGAFARLPAGWSHAEAATLPYAAGTAVDFLHDKAELKAGERVAILGAAGAVGRMAVQVARHRGAHVTAVVRGGDAGWLRELGADEVTTLDALDGSFDLLFDTPGALTPSRARRWLGPEGRYATLLITLAALLHLLRRAVFGGPRVVTGTAVDSAASMERLRALAEAGVLRPRIGPTFPLRELHLAHACAEAGGLHHDVIVLGAQAG
jgi:NADPH:quinone reductase-like Zn-dependent oxidoreductase